MIERGLEVDLRAGRLDGQLADPLDAQEPGMPFVGVEHLRLRMPGHRAVPPHRAETADPGQDLLADPMIGVAAVQPVGDLPKVLVVLVDVGVQQQQRDPTDVRLPDLRPQLAHGPRHRDVDQHRLAVVDQQLQRKRVRVDHRVVLDLPAVERQRLPEVPSAIEQPDSDHRHAQIGRRLEMVTRQYPEPARVVRQSLGHAELHREVRDRARLFRPVLTTPLVPAGLREVPVEIGRQHPGPLEELLVDGQLREPRRGQRRQHAQRVADLVEQLGVHGREEVPGRGMPRPPEVGGQGA